MNFKQPLQVWWPAATCLLTQTHGREHHSSMAVFSQELYSPLNKYLRSQMGNPRGRGKDRLACESATGRGNGPLLQPLDLPVSKAEKGEEE